MGPSHYCHMWRKTSLQPVQCTLFNVCMPRGTHCAIWRAYIVGVPRGMHPLSRVLCTRCVEVFLIICDVCEMDPMKLYHVT